MEVFREESTSQEDIKEESTFREDTREELKESMSILEEEVLALPMLSKVKVSVSTLVQISKEETSVSILEAFQETFKVETTPPLLPPTILEVVLVFRVEPTSLEELTSQVDTHPTSKEEE